MVALLFILLQIHKRNLKSLYSWLLYISVFIMEYDFLFRVKKNLKTNTQNNLKSCFTITKVVVGWTVWNCWYLTIFTLKCNFYIVQSNTNFWWYEKQPGRKKGQLQVLTGNICPILSMTLPKVLTPSCFHPRRWWCKLPWV